MREIIVKLYKFDELNAKAKEKARDWFRQVDGGAFQWENLTEDAKCVGIEIISLRDRHPNEGRFLASAEETAHKIEKEHGKTCETYKTAKAYLEKRDRAVDEAERDEQGDVDENKLDDTLDKLDKEFLHDILEDYRTMLEKENDYVNSNEYVDESIRINEYEFTEDGRRF